MLDDDEFAFHQPSAPEKRRAAAIAKIESAADIAAQPDDPIKWDFEGTLPHDDQPALVFGPPACGKTFVAIAMIDAAVRGEPFAGMRTRRRPSGLYVNLDAGPKSFRSRVRRMTSAPNFEIVSLSRNDFDADVFRVLLERHRGGFVVLDCLSAYYSPDSRLDPAVAMRAFVDDLRAVYALYDCGGVIIDHAHRPRDNGRSRGADRGDYFGSVQKEAAFRTMWIVSSEPVDPTNPRIRRVLLECRKLSEGPMFDPVRLEIEFGDRITVRRGYVLAIPPAESLVRNAIIAWARVQTNSFTQTDAANSPIGTGKTSKKIEAFKQLVDEGVFEVAQSTGRGIRYRLSTNSSRVPELLGTLGTASESGTVPAVPPLIGGTASGNSSESAMNAADDDRRWAVDSIADEAI